MSKRSNDYMDFHILGRKIGTYTGWDAADTFAIQVYDFVPAEGINLPASECMTFYLDSGKAEWFDRVENSKWEEGEWKKHYHWRDFLDIIKNLPFEDISVGEDRLPQDPGE